MASASGDVHCNVAAQFPQDSGVGIDVFCRAPSGALTDAQFMLSYYRDTNVGGPLGGYAYVSGVAPFATSNTWNSSGGPITVQGLAPGNYRVSFTGQLAGGDNAQVSALTSGGAYCTLGPPGGTAAPSTYVASAQRACPPTSAFRCSTATTSSRRATQCPADEHSGRARRGRLRGGVDPSRSRNTCQAGSNSAVLQQPANLYSEIYHAITTTLAEVPLMSLVSAMSSTGIYCNLNHFPIQGVRSDSRGFVSCFTPSGVPTTSTHSSMFIIQDRPGC